MLDIADPTKKTLKIELPDPKKEAQKEMDSCFGFDVSFELVPLICVHFISCASLHYCPIAYGRLISIRVFHWRERRLNVGDVLAGLVFCYLVLKVN